MSKFKKQMIMESYDEKELNTEIIEEINIDIVKEVQNFLDIVEGSDDKI